MEVVQVADEMRTLERLYRRGMSRRAFLRRSAALGISTTTALSFLAACGGGTPVSGPGPGGKPAGADGPVKLTFFVYVGANQGVVPREVMAEYMKANSNVTIELFEGTNAETYPKMVAARKTTPDQPLINFGYFNADATAKGDVDDMWEPLDPANVPTLTNVGKESDPAAVDKTFKLMSDKAKEGQIRLFFLSNDQVKQPMIRGEVWLSGWFNSSVDIWSNQEHGPFGYAAPKEGQVAFTLYHQVVKGSTPAQKYHAERIINLLNDKKWLTRYCNLTHSIPAGKDIQLDPELANQEAFKTRNIEGAIQLDWATLAAKNAEWNDRFNKEVVA